MTAPTLIRDEQDAHVEFIPGADVLIGHVIYFFGEQHRVEHFRDEQRAVDTEAESWYRDTDRHPARRVAVSLDGFELTIDPEQLVPVLVPTAVYQLDVFVARTPDELTETVSFVAETHDAALSTARRVVLAAGGAWGDIRQGDRDIDTVAVA